MSKSNKSGAVKNLNAVKSVKAPKSSKAPVVAEETQAAPPAPSIADAFAEMGARVQSAPTVAPPIEAFVAPKNVVRREHCNGAAFTTQRPGVLAHLENMLRTATAEAPVSKADMLASLVVAFADRDEAKMKTTLNMQVPSGFKIEKGYIIDKIEGRGYYLNVEKTALYQATHEKRGGRFVPKKTV